jgi:hypothetical protein
MTHYGITVDQVMRETGMSPERIHEYARQGFAWALPNVVLGVIVIVPIRFVVFQFRPPGKRSSDWSLNRLQNHHTWAPSAARSRRVTPPLVISDATIVPAATTAIMIVHTALISGFTPSRTSE